MLKTVVFSGLLTAALMCGQAMAQTENPQPGAPPSAGQAAPPAAGQETPPAAPAAPPAAGQAAPPAGAATAPASSNKAIIAGCRNDARAKGLRGPALQSAVYDCVGGQNPQLAARMRCHQQARAQGIGRGAAMKAFMRSCVAQAGQPAQPAQPQ
jgi:hypothetical protein